jgi:adenylate cyclase
MKKVIIVLTIILSFLFGQAKNATAQTNLDSLYAVWQDETQSDSLRVTAYESYIWNGYLFSNSDTVFVLTKSLLRFGEQRKNKAAIMTAYHLMGASMYYKSDYAQALNYWQRSLKVAEEIGHKYQVATLIGNIGIIYEHQGDYTKSIDYYVRSLKILEENGDKSGTGSVLMNIGLIYFRENDHTKALDYYQRSLNIFEENGDKRGISDVLNVIGNSYSNTKDDSTALDYYQRSLKIKKEIGDSPGIAVVLGNMGDIYGDQKNYDQAFDFLKSSIKIRKEIGDKWGITYPITGMGNIYRELGMYKESITECLKSLTISEEIGAMPEQNSACYCLYETYKAMGEGIEALVYLEKIKVIEDSINSEEITKQLQQMEFAKQVLADSLATAEETRLVEEAHQEEVRQKNQTRNALAGGGFLVLLLAGGIYSRLRYVRKSKAIIEEEKDRSNNLLLNILPADIAEELKIHGKAEARDFDMVSILFTDFKGFTAASEKLSAQELVAEINTCFEAFDGIMTKYGIEKIKTIGDAYMAAGGLPVPTDDSVKNTVLAALEMQAFIGKRKSEMDAAGKPAFEMRVGIHTGPVVAGIVGVKKFQYDIWGDTVNTAARMESSGDVAKVNVSQATYELLKEDTQFTFESRGKIEAKGKGEIEMYFVAKA